MPCAPIPRNQIRSPLRLIVSCRPLATRMGHCRQGPARSPFRCRPGVSAIWDHPQSRSRSVGLRVGGFRCLTPLKEGWDSIPVFLASRPEWLRGEREEEGGTKTKDEDPGPALARGARSRDSVGRNECPTPACLLCTRSGLSSAEPSVNGVLPLRRRDSVASQQERVGVPSSSRAQA